MNNIVKSILATTLALSAATAFAATTEEQADPDQTVAASEVTSTESQANEIAQPSANQPTDENSVEIGSIPADSEVE